ncbi:MAG TPA: DUF1583 domain-containing protein [Pirellulales bacterium]|nr:DUF1583 domain-containing protein [Pirellulales bacterium]
MGLLERSMGLRRKLAGLFCATFHLSVSTFSYSLLLALHFLLLTNLTAGEAPRATQPVLTLEQFGRAADIAKLAAENDLHELSLRAVREALRPGPPLPATAAGGATFGRATAAPRRVVGRSGRPANDSDATNDVAQRLEKLDLVWRQHGAPAESVYETLAEIVLPESRSAEIFLYPQPIRGTGPPRSVGRLLARWAVEAGSADDLKQRIEARQEQPPAELAVCVLLAQLAAAAGDSGGVAERLTWLVERLKTDNLANSAELAWHAVPDLNFVEQSPSAAALLEAIVKARAKLAVDPLRAINVEPNALHERFEWDFRGRPVDPSLFAPDFPFVPTDPAKVFFPVPDGLRIALVADQDKTNCAGYKTLFGVRGDFEIELDFTSLVVKSPAAGAQWGSGIELRLLFEETQDQHLARRCLQPDGSQLLLTCNARRSPGGADDWQFFQNTLECSSGGFKFVRKGTVLYYLFAADDGELVLYDERIVGRSDVKSCQIFALAFDRQSEADVVLKRFSVRAEGMSGK